jgi:hypothetical protein
MPVTRSQARNASTVEDAPRHGRSSFSHQQISAQTDEEDNDVAESEVNNSDNDHDISLVRPRATRRIAWSDAYHSSEAASSRVTPRANQARYSLPGLSSSTFSPAKASHLRLSLRGPPVAEMDINRRAEVLSDIAGDCLVKLVRVGEPGVDSKKAEAQAIKGWRELQGNSLSSRNAWKLTGSPSDA